jgi:hypothetical protein
MASCRRRYPASAVVHNIACNTLTCVSVSLGLPPLYVQGAREGAPQARQVADRFRLLQNLRETIETQLSRANRSTGRALLPSSDGEDERSAAIAETAVRFSHIDTAHLH